MHGAAPGLYNGEGTPGAPGFADKTFTSMTVGGTTDDGWTTPDSAAIDVTGDIDVRAKITYKGATQQSICDHWPFGGPYKWQFDVDTNDKLAFWNSDGTEAFSVSTATVTSAGHSSGDDIYVRVTYDVSASTLQFFTSTDGTTWNQLGANVSTGKTSLQSIAAALVVGNAANTSAAEIHWAEVRDGIAGTLVASWYASDVKNAATAFTSSGSGETWNPRGAYTMNP